MKKIIYFLPILLTIVSCAVKEKPIFLKVDNIKMLSATADTIKVGAKIYFKNPNIIGGKLATDEIKVIVNDVEFAQVSSEEFEVPAQKEFSIPVKVAIPSKEVFEKNKNGILGGLINTLLKQSVKVQLKGSVKYKVFGYSDVYLIDKTEDIKIKL